MTFASIIVGTLGVHTGLVTRVVLILSIIMRLFVLLVKFSRVFVDCLRLSSLALQVFATLGYPHYIL